MNGIVAAFDILGRHVRRFLHRNGPKLLTAAASGGVVVTAVLSAKATPKAMEHLKEAEDKKKEKTNDPDAKLTVVEKVKTVAPDYAGAAISGAATIGCMGLSMHLSGQQTAMALSAATLAQNNLNEHIAKTAQKFGSEQEEQVRNDIVVDKMKANPPVNVFETGDGDQLFYYVRYGNWFRSDIRRIRDIQIDLNDDIDKYGGVSENDLLHMLKLNKVATGETWGFPKYNSEGKREPRVEFKLVYYRTNDGDVNPDYRLDYILNGETAVAIDYYPYCGPVTNWDNQCDI